jgi:hypothetical protein
MEAVKEDEEVKGRSKTRWWRQRSASSNSFSRDRARQVAALSRVSLQRIRRETESYMMSDRPQNNSSSAGLKFFAASQ